ncbi:hypothetical protein [Terrabacter sp. 2YAF2]|uniref:hypothetical protein n=1 Tax=Terrabacter sp. 2YAF2 TaxID=3233026 RepID=UPI003F95D5B4
MPFVGRLGELLEVARRKHPGVGDDDHVGQASDGSGTAPLPRSSQLLEEGYLGRLPSRRARIEVTYRHSAARTCHIVEKVPVLKRARITAASGFPAEIWLCSTYERIAGDDVTVRLDEGVETTESLYELAVSANNVHWL